MVLYILSACGNGSSTKKVTNGVILFFCEVGADWNNNKIMYKTKSPESRSDPLFGDF